MTCSGEERLPALTLLVHALQASVLGVGTVNDTEASVGAVKQLASALRIINTSNIVYKHTASALAKPATSEWHSI